MQWQLYAASSKNTRVAKMVKINTVLKPSRPEDEMTRLMNDSPLMQDKRHYNGLSGIGEKCLRKLQYNHYDCLEVSFSCRMIRLFGVGHRMEDVLIEELNKFLGLVVTDQQARCTGFAGHWKGHIDGIGSFKHSSKFYVQGDNKFLMEFKTHKASSFADLKKNGVKKSKPMHYAQCTSYMGHLHLCKTLYVAYNKDTSEVYLEWVPFDADEFRDLKRKEAEVITADTLLPRIGNDSPMWHECKLCDAIKVCFGKEEIHKSCKNCRFVDIHDAGMWSCGNKQTMKGYEPCDLYEQMEIFNVD